VNKRPFLVTLLGCVLAAAGCVGLIYHLGDLKSNGPLQYDVLGIASIRLLAVIAGVFLIAGRNWAKWMALAWLALHVVISALHSIPEAISHAILLALFWYVLSRPEAIAFFHGRNSEQVS
jgi:hypothetical protein